MIYLILIYAIAPPYYLYMIIYKITNQVNNKVYIGLTTESLQKRWCGHKVDSKKKNSHLYISMRKYGIENFTIEIIDETDSFEKLGELERYYIKQYNSQDPNYGYNITAGGESNQLDGNPKAKLTLSDVINIRIAYRDCKLTCKQVYENYKHKIKFKPFERCYFGKSWASIMPEVFNEETRKKHKLMCARRGEKNGNSLYTNEEIREIRKYYEKHTFNETFIKYSKSKNKTSFNKVLRHEYKDTPLPSKQSYS